MKAIILAAGRGQRLGELTLRTPKPLVRVLDKPLICYTLEALPPEVDEVIVVIGYLGEQISTTLTNFNVGRPLRYVNQIEEGTAGALRSARHLLLSSDPFLVVGADDIFGAGELSKLMKVKSHFGYAIHYGYPRKRNAWGVLFDENHRLTGFELRSNSKQPRYYGTGAYLLRTDFFNLPMRTLANGELSIPHTLMLSSEVEVVLMAHWWPVNDLEELRIAEAALAYRFL